MVFRRAEAGGPQRRGPDGNPGNAGLSRSPDRPGARRPDPYHFGRPETRQSARSDDRSEGLRRAHHRQSARLRPEEMSEAIRTLDAGSAATDPAALRRLWQTVWRNGLFAALTWGA